MADLKYTVDVDSRAGINSLRRLNTQVSGTQQAFSRLGGAISGIAVGAVLARLGNFANSITDLSAATTISTQGILGFTTAIQRNGGSAALGQQAITRFTQTLGRAASGTKGATDSFAQLGISLEDINTQSPEQLLRAVTLNLGAVDDVARRTALGVEIFGRSFATIDTRGVAAGLDSITRSQAENARGVNAAGAANQNFANAIDSFQKALLKALTPLSELAVKLTENEEKVESFISAVIEISKALLLLKALGVLAVAVSDVGTKSNKASDDVKGLGTALAALVAFSSRARAGLLVFAKGIAIAVIALETLQFAFKALFDIDLKSQFDRLAGSLENFVTSIAPGLAETINDLGESLGMALSPGREETAAVLQFQQDVLANIKLIETEEQNLSVSVKDRAKAEQDAADAARQQVDFTRDLRISAEQTQRVYEDSFDTFQRQFQLQTDLLTLTEQEQLSVTVFAQFRENHLRQVAALEDEINSIVLDGTREQQQRLTSLVETQQRLIDTSQRQLPVLEELIEARQRALATQRQQQDAAQRVLELERETKAAVEAAARARDRAAATVTEFGRDSNDRLLEQQQAAELAGLTGIRRTLREIEIQENRVAAAARRRVEEQLGDTDTIAMVAAFAEIDKISQEITQRRSAAAQAISDEQRSFSAGWARAFAEYEDAATNSSLAAERIFRKTTQGMEDAIVGFARTGKFEFRSFTASILEEILRNNIRQLISSTFSATGIGGGGGGGGGGSRFGGFFATGGTIPAGRFGVVGEAGPELVAGPAQVTPMAATTINYNINAIDAQSFQQLLARDPALLFNLTEQGRRNFAGAR